MAKRMHLLIPILFSILPALTVTGARADATSVPKVRMETSAGAFTLELRPDLAPETVANFLRYVREGFYEGTLFHRVIAGFMIQGGGFDETLTRKSTHPPIVNEARPELPNLRGTIAMARTRNPDSATSQFFINVVDNHFLDAGVNGPGYAVFGKVVEGMEVVDAIAAVRTGYTRGMADVPVEPVVIRSVTLVSGAGDE